VSDTILITGASSGIGRATAELFHEREWNVIATMRTPNVETELTQLDGVLVVALDVTDLDSIQAAVGAGLDRFGGIDALVNNAGYGAFGPLEATPHEKIVRQFDTNVIGLLDTTKAVLPHFRAQGHGTIVNISSIGGRITFPLGSLYHGTKWAVEGISEALHFELEAIGVKVKIVEPGGVKTDFGGRSMDMSFDESMSGYQPVVQAVMTTLGAERPASEPDFIAEVIYQAVTDGSDKLRYPAGEDAHQLLAHREAVGDAAFIEGIKAQFELPAQP
jgi:NAD(P)-dependent dehydrogenase (short-subunit alcohol dehydrogenase family)